MTKLTADSRANNSDVHNVSRNVTPTFSGTSGGYNAHFQTIKNVDRTLRYSLYLLYATYSQYEDYRYAILYSKLLNVLHVTL